MKTPPVSTAATTSPSSVSTSSVPSQNTHFPLPPTAANSSSLGNSQAFLSSDAPPPRAFPMTVDTKVSCNRYNGETSQIRRTEAAVYLKEHRIRKIQKDINDAVSSRCPILTIYGEYVGGIQLKDFDLQIITTICLNGFQKIPDDFFEGCNNQKLEQIEFYYCRGPLPGSIKELSFLRELYINNHYDLSNLPEGMSELKYLEIRETNLNPCSHIGELKQLEILNLDSCELEEVPDFVNKLKNLRSLHLTNNRLTQFPSSLSLLKHLQSLNLSNNPLKQFPSSMDDFKKLEILNISGIKKLDNFFEWLENAYQLKSLRISKELRTNIPEQFSKNKIKSEETYFHGAIKLELTNISES